MRLIFCLLFVLLSFISTLTAQTDSLVMQGEKHLRNIRQLTFGGQNAEAYFSFDEKKLSFQSERDSFKCDQIYSMNIDGSNVQLLSNGLGKTTCSYFLPGDTTFLFASTYIGDVNCPPRPDYSKGYVWPIVKSFDIFFGNTRSNDLKRVTSTEGYDAEATVSPKGDKIVFTSVRDGDLDLYSMNLDGSEVKRLTDEIGYDGGAFYSLDGTQIVYRSHHPQDPKEIKEYKELLQDGFVRPTTMEISIMNADGSNKRQVTNLGAASFAPFFFPDGKRIIFSSNKNDPRGRNFDIFIINVDGSGLEQVTFNESFDGFPMFTRDGTKIVFASNRNGKVQGETNIFVADWAQ